MGKTSDRRDVSGFVRLGYFLLVARFARVIALDTPHHVTQRGKARQFTLTTDAERPVYLDLLQAICGPAPLFIAGRRRQTFRSTRDFGSSPGQPVIGGAISRREPRPPRPRPFARAPIPAIPDGRSAHRNLSKGWNATPAAPSTLRKAVARAKPPATHGNQLSIFSGNIPSVPGFQSWSPVHRVSGHLCGFRPQIDHGSRPLRLLGISHFLRRSRRRNQYGASPDAAERLAAETRASQKAFSAMVKRKRTQARGGSESTAVRERDRARCLSGFASLRRCFR
jgi:hypothetical protein